MSLIRDPQETESPASDSAGVALTTDLICRAAGTAPEDLHSLQRLNLHVRDRSFPKISSLDTTSLSACTALQGLNLSYHWISHVTHVHALASTLTELNLAENHITEISSELCSLTRLQLLNLSGNRIRCIPVEISALQELVSLRMSRNTIDTVQDIEHLTGLPKLIKLRIDNNPIALHENTRVYVLSILTQLQSLDGQVVGVMEQDSSRRRPQPSTQHHQQQTPQTQTNEHTPHGSSSSFDAGYHAVNAISNGTGTGHAGQAKSPNDTSTYFTPLGYRYGGSSNSSSTDSGRREILTGTAASGSGISIGGSTLHDLNLSPVASGYPHEVSYDQMVAPFEAKNVKANTPGIIFAATNGSGNEKSLSKDNNSNENYKDNAVSRRALLELSSRVELLTSRLIHVEGEKASLLQGLERQRVQEPMHSMVTSAVTPLRADHSGYPYKKEEKNGHPVRDGVGDSVLLSPPYGQSKALDRAHVNDVNAITPSYSYNNTYTGARSEIHKSNGSSNARDSSLLKEQHEYELKLEITKLSKLQATMQAMEAALEQEKKQRLALEQQQADYMNQQQMFDAQQDNMRNITLVQETEAARAQGALAEQRDLAMRERDSAVTAMQTLQLQLNEAHETSRKQMQDMQEVHTEAMQRQGNRSSSEINDLHMKLEIAQAESLKANSLCAEGKARIVHLETSVAAMAASRKTHEAEEAARSATLVNAQALVKELEQKVNVLAAEKDQWLHLQAQESAWKEQRKAAENAACRAAQEVTATETRLHDLRRMSQEQQNTLTRSAEKCKLAQEQALSAESRRAAAEETLVRLHAQIESATKSSNELLVSTQGARAEHVEATQELHVLQTRCSEVRNEVMSEEAKLKRVSVEGNEKLKLLQIEFDSSIAEHRRRENACLAMDKQVSESREEIDRKQKDSISLLERLQEEADAATEASRNARSELRGIQREISQLSKKKQSLQSEVLEMEDLLTSERGHRRTNEEEFKRHVEQLQRLLSETELRWRNLKEEVRVLEAAVADTRMVSEQQRRSHAEAERSHVRRIKEVEDIVFAKQEEAQLASRAVKSSNLAIETAQNELEQVTHNLRKAERQLTTARSTLSEQTVALDDLRANVRTTQGQLTSVSTQLETAKHCREQEHARALLIKAQIDADSKAVDTLAKKIHVIQLEDIASREALEVLHAEISELNSMREATRMSYEEIQNQVEQERHKASEMRTRRMTLENDAKRLENELSFTKERISDSVTRRNASEAELERTRDAISLAQRELSTIQRHLLEARRANDDIVTSTTNSRNERDRCVNDMEATSLRLAQESNALRETQTEKREVLLALRSLREDLRLLQGQHASAVAALELAQSQTQLTETSRQALTDDISSLRETIRTEQVRLNNTLDAQVNAETLVRNMKNEVNTHTISLENVRVNIRNEEHVLHERRRNLQSTTSQLLQVERDLKTSLHTAHQERSTILEEIGKLGHARQAAQQRGLLAADGISKEQHQQQVHKPSCSTSTVQSMLSQTSHSSHAALLAKAISSPQKTVFAAPKTSSTGLPAAAAAAAAAVNVAHPGVATSTASAVQPSSNNKTTNDSDSAPSSTPAAPAAEAAAAPSRDNHINMEQPNCNNSNDPVSMTAFASRAQGIAKEGEKEVKEERAEDDQEEEEEEEEDLQISAQKLRQLSLAVFSEAGIMWNEDDSIL